MSVPKALEYEKVMARQVELNNERSAWEKEWRLISDYLVPGRGIFQTVHKPRKRKLTSHKVINTVAEDSLLVLTSGMHAGLTSPTRPWFDLEWHEPELNRVEPLVAWLQECARRLHTALHRSNFYSMISNFYIEYAAFGTACTYMGEDTDVDGPPFRFELLTAGEYYFSTDTVGLPDIFSRNIFMTARQMVDNFPDTCPKEIKRKVEKNEAGTDLVLYTIVEHVEKRTYQDKPYSRVVYNITGNPGIANYSTSDNRKPLLQDGFYEFPYPLARWGTIGSDMYGIGPGARALPDIKRLQEMEKAFLMATHKTINPPLNAPGRMRGKLNTLPGGFNYYANPNEKVTELYQVRFDYTGVGGAVERVEERIRRNFFNDVFLTASRDPNASPLRTGQVQVQEQEKLFRLGPVVERLQFEYFTKVIERGFNIMMRKDLMPVLDPELAQMAGDYNINLVSPLATAQRAVALQGINSFLGFVGQAAQFDQSVLDNVNIDGTTREVADINGVQIGAVLRPQEEVDQIRQDRAAAQAAEQQRQEQMAMAQAQPQMAAQVAQAQKTQSEAGLNLLEGQQLAEEMGI